MHIQRQTPMELVLQDGSRWLSFLFIAVVVFVGVSSIEKHSYRGFFVSAFFLLFAVAFFRHSTFTLDKMQRIARWRRFTILKNETGSISFDSIRDIFIDTQAGEHGTACYRLTIVTTEGRTPMANMFEGGSIERYQHLRQQILDFIGLSPAVPTPEPGVLSDGIPADIEPSLRALLTQGRMIDAIALLRNRESIGLADAKSRIDALADAMKHASTTELRR